MVATPYKPLLGELLVETGVVTRSQLERALAEQRAGQERLGETLVRLNLVNLDDISAALAEQRKRWYAAAFGAAMMVIQPMAAAARSASAQMRVSVQVGNATTTNLNSSSRTVQGADGVDLSLVCAQPTLAHVTIGRVQIQQAAAAAAPVQASPYVAAAPNYKMTVTAMNRRDVACAPGATPVTVPVSLAPSPTGDSISIQIAY
ncbi:MAG TPA: hypothetical protein VN823_08245 [Stellaceae bacterium]|nr:hypothetical protein [Stellaceae bacterium]